MKAHPNQAKGRTENNDPTLTDQSQAANTDINIIVTQFLRTGQTPSDTPAIFADFTQLPEDLRGFIEMGRSIDSLVTQLPEALRGIPVRDLIGMTNEQINAKLKPPEEPASKKEEQK